MLERWLPEQLEANHDLTLEEHREAFEEEHGVLVSTSTVGRAIARLPNGGWPIKKSLGAAEREPEFPQAAWRFLVAGEVDAERFVFVDECGRTPPWPRRTPDSEGTSVLVPGRHATGAATSRCRRASMPRRAGTLRGRGGGDRGGGLRGLRGAGAGPVAATGTGGGDGQPLGARGPEGARARPGAGLLRAVAPAALLARSQPHSQQAFSKLKASLRRAILRWRSRLLRLRIRLGLPGLHASVS